MEEVFVDSPSGSRIQVLLVKPHGFDPAKKYPAIVNVHGGPQMQWADAFRGDAQVYPGAGYVVAFPNPHGSTGWGQAFTAAISRDWDGKVMQDVQGRDATGSPRSPGSTRTGWARWAGRGAATR